MSEKLTFGLWPLGILGLFGFGALQGYEGHHLGWEAFAGVVNVLLSVGSGIVVGLMISDSVRENLIRWATLAQALCDQEERAHERTLCVLEDLAEGVVTPEYARQYLNNSEDEEGNPQ